MTSVASFVCECGERFPNQTAMQFHQRGACTRSARPTLLRDVPDNIYIEALDQLRQMRHAHPGYRDDQLLLKLFCSEMTPKSIVYRSKHPFALPIYTQPPNKPDRRHFTGQFADTDAGKKELAGRLLIPEEEVVEAKMTSLRRKTEVGHKKIWLVVRWD